MKKNFNIIILNNSTQKNYSLSINKITLYTLSIFLIVILLFSIFGLFRFMSPHAKQTNYNQMYDFKTETNNLFQLINLDSLISQNTEIKQYLDLIPNNKPAPRTSTISSKSFCKIRSSFHKYLATLSIFSI